MMLQKLKQSLHLLAPASILSQTEFGKLTGKFSLKALDVGARGGFDTLLTPIADIVEFIGFEPDEAEVKRLEADRLSKGPWLRVRYLPVALGNTADSRLLYLTQSPGCSSLLPSNPDMYTRYGREELFTVVGTTEVATVMLDDAARKYSFQEASYLKIDIQGAELEVLNTGKKLLASSIVAIRAEVEFQQIYKDQPLFRDIDTFLAGQGFHLVDFHQPVTWPLQTSGASLKSPFVIGRDCLGELIHTDALYFRDLDAFSDSDENAILVCIKAAMLALAYGRLSYAAVLFSKKRVKEYLTTAYGVDVEKAMADARLMIIKHNKRNRLLSVVRLMLGR
jgi:FkbM family methyltransferase